jgi:hypothetical protein
MSRKKIIKSVTDMCKKRWVKWIVIVLLFQCVVVENSVGQELVHAINYGVQPNNHTNSANAIRKAIAVCKAKKNSILLLPGGRIDIWPEAAEERELYISNCTETDSLSKVKHIAFLFEACKNITLEGNNTLVVLHGKMISFAIINSSNIKIKNIQFDYERPTMSEMRVNAASDDSIEVIIHPDSKYFIENSGLWFYGEGWKTKGNHANVLDSILNTMRHINFNAFLKSSVKEMNPYTVLFKGDFKNLHINRGDIITVRDTYRDNCGAFISLSKNIALDNVKMYYMHGMGVVSQFSENISLRKVRIAPASNSGRVISSWADCFHFSGCKGKISLDSCFTSGAHDDAVNIHGTQLQIVTITGANKIMVRFMHHQTYGFSAFFAGDSIAVINPRTLLPVAKIKLRSATMINKFEMELETEGSFPVSTQVGFCVENLTWYPEVSIKNCRFERTHTRGILISTRKKSVIEKNVFFNTGMAPILIADDASSWFESGAVNDILIRNNLFDYSNVTGGGTITIAPENKELVEGKSVHRNIRIIGNEFRLNNSSLLNARSTEGLVFKDNKIVLANGIEKPLIYLTACKNALIENNNVNIGGSPIVQISKMTQRNIKTNWRIEIK